MRRRATLIPLLMAALAAVLSLGIGWDSAAAATVTRYEQGAAQLARSGTWTTVTSTSASGGSYTRADAPGAVVSATFKGTSFAWIAPVGPGYGIASVSLDGGSPLSVDLYGGAPAFGKVWSTGALASGYHTVRISWTGRKNTAVGGTAIGIDAFDVAGTLVGLTRVEQTDRHLGWRGAWTKTSLASYSGGTAWFANTSGSSVTVEFDGAGVKLLGKKGPNYGLALVRLDGGAPMTVDLYDSNILFQQALWSSGWLKPGHHVVTLSWTGQKRAVATDTNVALDAVELRGALTAAPGSQLAFDQTRAMAHLYKLSVGIGVRHGGSPQELQAAQYGMAYFQSLGYSTRMTDVPLPDGTTSHNVIAVKPGSSALTVVVGGHMDSFGLSPGGNDNGSGAAAVLELARAIKNVDLVPTVVLVLFGHEEPMGDGNADHHHYGSRRYVATMTAQEKANLAGMISLDMIGAGTTLNVRYMERGPRSLVTMLMNYSARTVNGAVYMKDPSTYGYSDHEPFELAGFPAAWVEWREATSYHTAADTYYTVSPGKVQLAGGMVLGFLAGLRQADLSALAAASQ